MSRSKTLSFLFFFLLPQLVGFVGSVFTTPSIPSWYASLMKPMLNPPGWVFGPVWTILYALMGIAAFLIWREGYHRKDVRKALGIFGVQLALNLLWSILFFGLHNPLSAFIEIIFLWLAILSTLFTFHKISRRAAYLLIPYLLWVTFAAYLNFELWRLN